MEPKIGSLLNIANQLYYTQEIDKVYGCEDCSFNSTISTEFDICNYIKCHFDDRKDRKNVIFTSLQEKVGLFGKTYNTADVLEALESITPIK